MLPYEVIVWDWNGTLLDDAQFGADIVNGLLRERGLPERSREDHARLFDFPVIRYYERLGFDFSREPFEAISHDFVASYYASVHACPLHAGTRQILAALQAAGYRQVVLSATRQDLLERVVKTHGLTPYFETLVGIDSVHAPGKGGRGCEWIAGAGVDPARVLLVGDTVHDAEVAQEMGINCWLVNAGHHPEYRLRETGMPLLADLAEVERMLLGADAGREQA
jgi:phosphoglycolate phosphatase